MYLCPGINGKRFNESKGSVKRRPFNNFFLGIYQLEHQDANEKCRCGCPELQEGFTTVYGYGMSLTAAVTGATQNPQ
jgi:hypothetical protein